MQKYIYILVYDNYILLYLAIGKVDKLYIN